MCTFILRAFLFSIALALSQPVYAFSFNKVLSNPILLTTLEKSNGSIHDLARNREMQTQITGPVDNVNLIYGPVKPGETLVEIARNIFSLQLNLNQILIALYRSNREAFSGNNMNRLKAGAVLQIPDNSRIITIDLLEADKEVKMQAADWQIYQHRLIETVNSIPHIFLNGVVAQASADKISIATQEDVVGTKRLSKEFSGILRIDRSTDGNDKDASNIRNQALAIENTVKNKEITLRKVDERIAVLEQNIKDMQHLLELKDSGTINMKQQIDKATFDTRSDNKLIFPPVVKLPIGQNSAILVTPIAENQHDVSEIVLAPVVENSVVSTTNLLPQSSLEDTSLIYNLMSNFEYVGGIFGVILVGVIWIAMTSKKKETAISDSSGERLIDPVKNAQLCHKIMDSRVIGIKSNIFVPELYDKSSTDFDLTRISLEMNDAISFVKSENNTFVERNSQWYEVATKIDLVRIYKEMDAHGSAKEILLEIINEGDAQQRAHAESMLVNLKNSD